jgi:hypothetical protein
MVQSADFPDLNDPASLFFDEIVSVIFHDPSVGNSTAGL